MQNNTFVWQLMETGNANVTKELTCCKKSYSISLPSGSRMHASGFTSFAFKEQERPPVLFVDYTSVCSTASMDVKFCNSETLTITKKSMFSRSLVILNGSGNQVLKIKRPVFQSEFEILGENNSHIGVIKKDWLEYELSFPSQLDVKYKAALLASCIFMVRRWPHWDGDGTGP